MTVFVSEGSKGSRPVDLTGRWVCKRDFSKVLCIQLGLNLRGQLYLGDIGWK